MKPRTFRVGRRGLVLLILGAFDLVYGWSLMSLPVPSSSSAAWREHYAPGWVWGGAWLLAGVVILGSAPLVRDIAGYVAGIAIKVLWGLQTIWSWAFGGVDRGWISGLVWLAFAGLVWVIAGWRENPPPPTWEEVKEDASRSGG